jgi:hypothetical protein
MPTLHGISHTYRYLVIRNSGSGGICSVYHEFDGLSVVVGSIGRYF